jgi:hypothetical protein
MKLITKEGKHLSNMFPIKYGLKQGDALLPLYFNCAVEYAVRRVQVHQDDMKLHDTHQRLVYADDINMDTVQFTGPKMAAMFLLTDTCVAVACASGFAPCT